jgi:hypothetical protein
MYVRASRLGVLTVPSGVLPAFPAVVTSGQVAGSTAALGGCALRHTYRYLPAQALDITRPRDLAAEGVRIRAV